MMAHQGSQLSGIADHSFDDCSTLLCSCIPWSVQVLCELSSPVDHTPYLTFGDLRSFFRWRPWRELLFSV
jgi:hypothetical protein